MPRNSKLLAVAILMAALLASESRAQAILSAVDIDWSCVDFRIIGICIRHRHGKTIVVPKVQYWWPRALIETVPRPGQSLVLSIPGTTGLASVVEGEQYLINNEKFMEAHVFTFKPPEPCDRSYRFYLSYASEYDALNWRTGIIDTVGTSIWKRIAPIIPGISTASCLGLEIPQLRDLFVGCWGPLYPRQGWVMQLSDPVVSALLSYRAIDLAARIYHTFPYGSSLHDKIQLAYPRKKKCMRIGTHPIKWEHLASKPGGGGKYLWVYWKKVTCCLW